MHPFPRTPTSAPLPLALWILFCVYFNCAGWLLSWAGQLNAAGYTIACALGALLALWWLASRRRPGVRRSWFRKWRRRFCRPFPLAFLVLASLAILGGTLYPPSNPDGLTQRIPRVLNWLAAGHWHWIENPPPSFNTRAVGFEWLMAPLIALSRTDRFIYLLNACSYLLLPGLVFSVFTRLGVRSRVAWHWMWLVPSGYCFVVQAGSIGNDAAGAVIALAALDLALRARGSRDRFAGWLSVFAAALLTNAKASNLTLLLPWAIVILPVVPSLFGLGCGRLSADCSADIVGSPKPVKQGSSPFCSVARLLQTATLLIVAGASSLLPIIYFNVRHLGDWSGTASENPQFLHLTAPVALAGNALNLTAQNLVPPVFPMAGWWNEHAYKLLPKALVTRLEECFEAGGAHVKLMEMQIEVAAGLGFGVTLLLVISWFAAHRQMPKGGHTKFLPGDLSLGLVRWSPMVCLLVYMMKTGLSTSARLITPYYALLIPVLLMNPGHQELVRKKWWRFLAGCVFALAGMLIVLNPGRPLWPAQTVLTRLSEARPQSAVLARARLLYESYAGRWDVLAPVRNELPPGTRNVGIISFLSSTTIETSLWRPFGSRRVWWLRPDSTCDEAAAKGINYVVIATDSPLARKGDLVFETWFDSWLKANHGQCVARHEVRVVATGAPSPWFLVRLGDGSNPRTL